MATVYTWNFTSRPDMYGEHTFTFPSDYTGRLKCTLAWSLRCYNVWGAYTGSGAELDFYFPQDWQLRVGDLWGHQNFGRAYLEILERTSTSVKVKHWVKCYHPNEWYNGLTYSCTLTIETDDGPFPLNATEYWIQVNTQSNFLGTMKWNSNWCGMAKVENGSRCTDIEYMGSTLDLTGVVYYWRIKFRTADGNESPWSEESARFSGTGITPEPEPEPVPDQPPQPYPWWWHDPYWEAWGGYMPRIPKGKVEVETSPGVWTELVDVMAITVSNNKNPLDNIETSQGTVYLSNISARFHSDNEASEFYEKLSGRRIRISMGFYDYYNSQDVLSSKMLGVVKNVATNRKAMTAEIIVLEFLDYYKRKSIKQTPVYYELSIFELYCELVRYCFPNWLNQYESPGNWDYFVDSLGFRRLNVYLGTGTGATYYVVQDHSRDPAVTIYDIIDDSEALYIEERRLIKGTDYYITQNVTNKGTETWIYFLQNAPTSEQAIFGSFTVNVKVDIVQYKDTTLIAELEKIAMVADCRIYSDVEGRLICKSDAPGTSAFDTIKHDRNLMQLSTRRDIDGIVNHVIVESKPFQLGENVSVGSATMEFSTKGEAEVGAEHVFAFDEYTSDLLFDVSWTMECGNVWGTYIGSGSAENVQLPYQFEISVSGMWGSQNVADGYIEPVDFDSLHMTIKHWVKFRHPGDWYTGITYSVTITCKGTQIGQPIVYRGDAIDEASFQDLWIGEKPQTFTLEYLAPGRAMAQQAAESLLSVLRKLKTYYDCLVRGMPHIRLLHDIALTDPTASLDGKLLQVISLVDNLKVADYQTRVGLMLKQVPIEKVPYYWSPEEYTFVFANINAMSKTYKFVFDSEISGYSFDFEWSLVAYRTLFWGHFNVECRGSGSDLNFSLTKEIAIVVASIYNDEEVAFGTLTISLVEATSTSVEIKCELVCDSPGDWLDTVEFEGTLTCFPEFAYGSPSVKTLPHYPKTEASVPASEQPSTGFYYE